MPVLLQVALDLHIQAELSKLTAAKEEAEQLAADLQQQNGLLHQQLEAREQQPDSDAPSSSRPLGESWSLP